MSAALGLGCWVATLLAFSASVTPFQRFDGLASFIAYYPRALVLCECLACALIAGLAWSGRSIPARVLLPVGGLCHVAGCALFSLMPVMGIGWLAEPMRTWVACALVLLTSTGELLTALAWGRAIKGFGMRRILAVVSLAGMTVVAISLVLLRIPPTWTIAAFSFAALLASALPGLVGVREPTGVADDDLDEGGTGKAQGVLRSKQSIVGMLHVSASALMGLVFFAYVMALMGENIVATHDLHLSMLFLASSLLAALALPKTDRPLLAIAYQRALPVCAVVLLAVGNISSLLTGGSDANMAALLLLYYLAALLSLGILGAIARADEFSSDLVMSTALGIFCLASFAGFASSFARGHFMVSVMVTTTVYASVTVLLATGRSRRPEVDVQGVIEGQSFEQLPDGARELTLGERCSLVAMRFHLTERETKMLTILAEGYSCNYAAEVLYISPSTARTHAHNIYAKLGVNSREQLMSLVRDEPPGPVEQKA